MGEQMKTSPLGLAFLRECEGCELKPYKDSVGLWTVGVGHLLRTNEQIEGITWTRGIPSGAISVETCDGLLAYDVARFERAILSAVSAAVKLTQCEFDALVSLAFNIGEAAISKSTLVRKLNALDRPGAEDQFLVWKKAKNIATGQALQIRRSVERGLFKDGDYKKATSELRRLRAELSKKRKRK
jgi:lysozyme